MPEHVAAFDLVVTVPMHLWDEWIEEGDAAGEPPTGEEWGFYLGGAPPPFVDGARLYIVSHGRVRGYAPITRVVSTDRLFVVCREGGAVACTIEQPVRGFRGWRYRWWSNEEERPFPDWRTAGVRRARGRA